MANKKSVYQAVRERRSVRWFDPDWRMGDEEFMHLMEHVILSPTANNIQDWRFVRVTDRSQREAIRRVAFDQAQITDASELVIFCYNKKAWRESPERYWRNASQEVAETILSNFTPYFTQPGVEQEEGLRSCAMAAMSMMLLAKEMGYDSCPMTGFDFSAVAELINLPLKHRIAMVVALGKQVKEPWPRGGQLPLYEVIVENRFS